ncbi:MAG: phage Gp37/Gp68 family protein [Cyanobacteria bacterium J06638_22]
MTSIEWTEKTWNPVTGCTKISPGCAHCYAADLARRFWGNRQFSDIQFHEDRLEQPLKRRKPTMWFVNSMSDLFHESIADEQLDQIFAVMALTPQHIYQVLTKRPERMLKYLSDSWNADYPGYKTEYRVNGTADQIASKFGLTWENVASLPLPNVWLGVTAENQSVADERIPLLLQTPASVRFLSCEPLLSSLRLDWKVDWVIIGGESGSKARKFRLEWAIALAEQCKAADIPYFVKQMGSKPTYAGTAIALEGKGTDLSTLPSILQVREWPQAMEGRTLGENSQS